MKPVTRKEIYLAKLCGQDVVIPTPVTREEVFLARACGEEVVALTPVTRYEMLLDNLSGGEHDITPVTRLEYFIAKAAGADVPELTPVTREEYWWANANVTHGEVLTVTGVSPLSLINAIAHKLVSLTQEGKCEQASNPSPSSPVDIVCNNGALKLVSDGVPTDYVRLEYLESSGTQYIDTGIVPTADLESEAEWMSNVRLGVYGTRWSGSPRNDTYGVYRAVNSSTTTAAITFYFGNYSDGESAMVGTTENVSTFRTKIGLSEVSANGATAAITRSTISTNLTIYAFAFNVSGTASFMGATQIYSLKFSRGGETIADFVPCMRRADGVLGMYDTVSGSFKTNQGTGTFTAGAAVGHVGVVGTSEVITLGEHTANAVNLYGIGEYADTQEIISGDVTHKVGIIVIDGTEAWNTLTNGRGYYIGVPSITGVPADAGGWCTHLQYSVWSTQTDPMPDGYFGYNKNSRQTTANGNITFQPGITEFPTVSDWKSFLAAQYAAGTPVILIYPLATPTTEQVTGQNLSTVSGTNTLTVTANVSNIPLEVEYMGTT